MKIRILLALLILSKTVQAQFSAEAFLSAAVSDIELEEIQASHEFMQSNKFNSPWLRELEFRVKSNDREIGLEDYRLRFGFMNPYEIRANKNYQKELSSTIRLRRQMKLNEVLKMRYELLIEHIYLSHQILNSEKLLEFYRGFKVLVFEMERGGGVEQLLDLEDDIFKLKSKLADLYQKLKINQYLINEKLEENTFISLDTSNIISSQYIFQQLTLPKDSVDLATNLTRQEIKLMESRFNVEKAESFRNIGFFQADYDTERGDELDEQLGYRVGVTIPIFNPDKPDLQRDELSMIQNQLEQEKELILTKRRNHILNMDIAHINEQMQLIDEYLTSIQVFESIDNRLDIDRIRKTTEYRSTLESRKLGLYTLLIRKYIDKLYQMGKLTAYPMVNHISRELLPLSINPE